MSYSTTVVQTTQIKEIKIIKGDDYKEDNNAIGLNIEIDYGIDLASMTDAQIVVALKARVVNLQETIKELQGGTDESPAELLQVTGLVQKETITQHIVISEEIMKQQNKISRTLEKHLEIVNEWLNDCKILSNLVGTENFLTTIIDVKSKTSVVYIDIFEDKNDDIKEEVIVDNECALLLDKHSKCQILILRQIERMKKVPGHAHAIFEQKRDIIRLLRDYESSIKIEQLRIKQTYGQLDNVHERTIELKAILDTALSDYDVQVKLENKVNVQRWELTANITTTERHMKIFHKFVVPCAKLMRKYQLFQRLTIEKTKLLKKRLVHEWDLQEQGWFAWNVTHFVHWVRYKLEWYDNKLARKFIVKTDVIENQLRNRMYIDDDGDGFLDLNLNIMTMNDLLIFFNLAAENHDLLRNINDISVYISIMVEKYPHKFQKSGAPVNVRTVEVPPKFLCALTHTIMTEPVFVFDGYTYERSAILAYLKEHRKSPITDDVFVDREEFLDLHEDEYADEEDGVHEDELDIMREKEDKKFFLYVDTNLVEEIEQFKKLHMGATFAVGSGVVSRQKRTFTSSDIKIVSERGDISATSVTTVTVTKTMVQKQVGFQQIEANVEVGY